MGEVQYSQRFVEETAGINRLVLGHLLPSSMWAPLPHAVQTWLRNYLASIIVYLGSNSLWCFYIYYWKRNVYLPKDVIPSRKAVMAQIYVAMKALPWLNAALAFSEYLVENGWTKSYLSISEVGLTSYLLHLSIYIFLLEVCIYWTHRALHEIKPLYKYFHSVHHKYNKQNTLSPFAGVALHPMDGILNSLPYILLPCIVPVHFATQSFILYIDGVFTTSTHDCIDAKMWPVMGAGYHTIHHTTYKHNYGHYTVWVDWMFGTLLDPLEDQDKKK